MYKFIILFSLFLISFSGSAQDISYDTTYQVTYENGIKDSVIIITKKVVMKEMVYIVDSTRNNKLAVDFFITPLNKNTTSSFRKINAEEISGTNKLLNQLGYSAGTNLYYCKGNWEWRGGIQFSKYKSNIRSNRSVKNEYTQTYTENDTLDYYYSVGEFEDTTYYYIIEPKEVTKTITEQVNHSDKASYFTAYIGLSLQAGYRKEFNNWNICLFAGPVMEFFVLGKGNTFNDSGERINVKDINLTTPLINAQINCQIAYTIGKSTQVYLEPYYQKFLFSINSSNMWMRKNDLAGAKMGIKIFL